MLVNVGTVNARIHYVINKDIPCSVDTSNRFMPAIKKISCCGTKSSLILFRFSKTTYKKSYLNPWYFQLFGNDYKTGRTFFKVNNENTKRMCEICSKLTVKTTEPRQWPLSDVVIVNFEQISHTVLAFPCWLWTTKFL